MAELSFWVCRGIRWCECWAMVVVRVFVLAVVIVGLFGLSFWPWEFGAAQLSGNGARPQQGLRVVVGAHLHVPPLVFIAAVMSLFGYGIQWWNVITLPYFAMLRLLCYSDHSPGRVIFVGGETMACYSNHYHGLSRSLLLLYDCLWILDAGSLVLGQFSKAMHVVAWFVAISI